MKKVIVIVKDGLYLSAIKSEKRDIGVEIECDEDYRLALVGSLNEYNNSEEYRKGIDEIASFSEGDVAVMEESVKTLDGNKIYMEALREMNTGEEKLQEVIARLESL